jgi:ABC-2 type transport system ATP-binding protein
MPAAVIKAAHVSKSYNSVRVLDDVCLEINRGDFFAFLGENGSGKSTFIGILLGLIPPDPKPGTEDSSPTDSEAPMSLELFGMPLLAPDRASGGNWRMRRKIGVVGEAALLNDDRSIWAYLDFFARLYGIKNRKETIAARLNEVELYEARGKKIRALSRGMKQRLSLARALLHDPELLILDEPINGLDPKGIHDTRELLERENQKGKTIMLSSHLLSEVEKSCSRVGIIHKGRLLVTGDMAEVAAGDLEAAYLRCTSEAGDTNEG